MSFDVPTIAPSTDFWKWLGEMITELHLVPIEVYIGYILLAHIESQYTFP